MQWQVSDHRIICESELNQRLSEVPLSCIESAHSSNAVQEVGSRGRRDAEFQGGKNPNLLFKGSSLVYVSAVMYTKSYTSGGQITSNFAAINMAATPTSCNCLRGTGRQSRYWSIRHTVRIESRSGACSSLRHRPANRSRSHATWRSIAAGDPDMCRAVALRAARATKDRVSAVHFQVLPVGQPGTTLKHRISCLPLAQLAPEAVQRLPYPETEATEVRMPAQSRRRH